MTTTVTFHNCRNRNALVSPGSDKEMSQIAGHFVYLLRTAGFDVVREKNGLNKVLWHRFWDPNEEWGYTMGAVLSASDASVHTYPENEYGCAYELELNLCYLKKEHVGQHDYAVKCLVGLLLQWLEPENDVDDVEVEQSRARYFRPIEK